MSGGNPFALIEVENAVIAQKRDLLLLTGFLVLLLDPFPEHDHVRLLAPADVPARLPALSEGQIFAGLAKKHLIQKTVRLAGCVADAAPTCNPRLVPRDFALLHLLDDSTGDFFVNIHFLLLPVAGEPFV